MALAQTAQWLLGRQRADETQGWGMTVGGPASWRPPGEGWQLPPEPQDDEVKRQQYAAHRRRRHVPASSIVALIALIAIVAGIALVLALNLL